MRARLALLVALVVGVLLSLGATGSADAAWTERGARENHLTAAGPLPSVLGGARRETGLKSLAERRSAQIEDDDDDLDCRPDAMGHSPHAALPPRPVVGTRAARVSCRLALARSAAFRARQRLDDSFPTGPPSILRQGRPV